METKFSLFLFPLLYFSSGTINKQQLNRVLNAFVYGCLVSAAICFFHALYQYFYTQYTIAQGIWAWNYGINYFLKERLSIWIHPSYRAMYFVIALAAIYLQEEHKQRLSVWKKYFIPLILTLFIFLFSSKSGIISLLFLGIFVISRMVFKERRYKSAVSVIFIFASIFYILYFFAPQFALSIDKAIHALSENVDVKKSEESTASRIAIWNAAKVIISENWLIGTGTGDVKDVLLREYDKQGMIFALEKHLNAHNQFLQTFIALGVAGFLVLLASFFFPFVQIRRTKDYLYAIFLILLFFNFIVESMLETQAGVMFYAFFNSLFLTSAKET